MLRTFICLAFLSVSASAAHAVTGGSSASAEVAAQTAIIVSGRGNCSAAVIARDLLLTAAHCVERRGEYVVLLEGGMTPRGVPVTRIVLHPNYDPHQFEKRKPSPDIAIVKISEPLPARFNPARLMTNRALPKKGDPFTVAGAGFSIEGDPHSAGKIRMVTLPTIGTTTFGAIGGSMVRLSAGNGPPVGACDGDSGGPVFQGDLLAAVISWVYLPTGRNCGPITAATLVASQRDWIISTARSLGAVIRE
jgi:hypothetical protein